MTRRLALILALACLVPAAASAAPEPRLVRVALGPGVTLERLLGAGLDVVDVRGGRHATILEWPADRARLAALGAAVEVVDEAPGRAAARLAAGEMARIAPPARDAAARSARAEGAVAVPPIGSGSMGGYYTTAEIKAKLDELVANDPHDLAADRLDTLGTSLEGRPVWGLMLGRTRGGPNPPPLVLFTALTHAREPGGMQALFHFVDDIQSRYGTDPFATYLLEKRRIYIVPIVNPDGYAVNEDIYAGSGGTTFGYWRKNKRDNNGSTVFESDFDGVDLNRNYGYEWGYDNVGSSPDPTTQVYRGPSPFSEPETVIQRDMVDALEPITGFSFHTHGDLAIHPWGYTDVPSPHREAFYEWNDLLTRENAYLAGEGPQVLYPVNGEFNDWAYGDTLTKPRAYTWTPELGSPDDGFWPPPSRIEPIASENLQACYRVAAIAGAYVHEGGWEILEGALNASYGAHLVVQARNAGLAAAGPGLTSTLTPLDAGVRMLVNAVSYPVAGARQTVAPVGSSAFEMVVDDTVTVGRAVRFRIEFTDASGLYSSDTLVVALGTPTVVAFDDGSSGLGKWTNGPPATWGIVSNDPAHPSRYFTDTPSGNYTIGANVPLRLVQALNLSSGVHAYALFEARWEIESDYDAAWARASLDGVNWTLIRSTGTTPGSGINVVQPAGQPVFTGARRNWAREMADLSAFTGPAATAVRFEFRMRSDAYSTYDGFSFDSLRIVVYDPAAQPALVAVGVGPSPARLELSGPAPNPARAGARFEFAMPSAGAVSLEILDLQGRRVRTLASGTAAAGRYARAWDLADADGRRAAPGVYFARLAAGGRSVVQRFAVVR